MSNSIVSEIVGAVAIEKLTKALAPFSAFATDCSPEGGESGGTVVVAGVGEPTTAGAEFAGSYSTGADSNVDKVSVTLKHYFTAFYLTDKEFSSSSANRLSNLVGAKANAFGGHLTTALTAIFDGSNFGGAATSTVADASYAVSSVKALKAALEAKGAPLQDRAFVLNAAALGNLLPTSIETLGSEVLSEGTVNRIYGCDTFATNALDNTNINVNGFMAHRSAIAVASRLPAVQDESSLIDYQVFDIPNLGLNIAYKSFVDNVSNRTYGVLETLAGSAVGNDDGLVYSVSS